MITMLLVSAVLALAIADIVQYMFNIICLMLIMSPMFVFVALDKLKHRSKKLFVFISDNGKGFDLEKNQEGNGLKNMYDRAKKINAEFLIESISGTGTKIKLSISLS